MLIVGFVLYRLVQSVLIVGFVPYRLARSESQSRVRALRYRRMLSVFSVGFVLEQFKSTCRDRQTKHTRLLP